MALTEGTSASDRERTVQEADEGREAGAVTAPVRERAPASVRPEEAGMEFIKCSIDNGNPKPRTIYLTSPLNGFSVFP